MTIKIQRRNALKVLYQLSVGAALSALPFPALAAADAVPALMYKNPTCSCCETYAAYLENNGFKVDIKPTHDLDQIAAKLGVPQELRGCHTIKIGNYLVEGFVPIGHIRKMFAEMPKIAGLAMPGMPMGIPNMGFPLMPGMAQQIYTTMAFTADDKAPFIYGTYPEG